MVLTVRSEFTGVNQVGDFRWMIEQPEYADALFIFNDNQSQFYEHQESQGTDHRCFPGGGNATIRPYQCQKPPRATGIPTGEFGGYNELDESSRTAIDDAIAHLDSLLSTGNYARVIYSWDAQSQTLGTGIFNVAPEVTAYIVERIDTTASRE